jgi:hypothetical protein
LLRAICQPNHLLCDARGVNGHAYKIAQYRSIQPDNIAVMTMEHSRTSWAQRSQIVAASGTSSIHLDTFLTRPGGRNQNLALRRFEWATAWVTDGMRA